MRHSGRGYGQPAGRHALPHPPGHQRRKLHQPVLPDRVQRAGRGMHGSRQLQLRSTRHGAMQRVLHRRAPHARARAAQENLHRVDAVRVARRGVLGVAVNLGNIGNVYAHLSYYQESLEYLEKSLAIYEELGNKNGIANNLGNMGNVYANLADYPRSLKYTQKALTLFEELGNKAGVAHNLANIGEVCARTDFDGYNPNQAEEYLLLAVAMNDAMGARGRNIHIFKTLSKLYSQMERWKESKEYFEKYYEIEKEVQSEEAKKQAGLMEQRRQAADLHDLDFRLRLGQASEGHSRSVFRGHRPRSRRTGRPNLCRRETVLHLCEARRRYDRPAVESDGTGPRTWPE